MTIESLAKSMDVNGLLNPITVEKRQRTYRLLDGTLRLKAAKLLGWKTIEATVLGHAIIGNRIVDGHKTIYDLLLLGKTEITIKLVPTQIMVIEIKDVR